MNKFLLILTLSLPIVSSAQELDMEIYNWGEKNDSSALTIDSSDDFDTFIETKIKENQQGKFLTIKYWYSEPIDCSAYETNHDDETWYIGADTIMVKQQCKKSKDGNTYIENTFDNQDQLILVNALTHNRYVYIENPQGEGTFVSSKGFAKRWYDFLVE